MKRMYIIVIIFFALVFLLAWETTNAQIEGYCRSSQLTASTFGGYQKLGFAGGVEAGCWNVVGGLGLYTGFSMYNEEYFDYVKHEHHKEATIDFHGRITYKVASDYDKGLFQVATIYGSINGQVGLSYRFYKQLQERILLGIEPNYSNKNKGGVNLLLTLALD